MAQWQQALHLIIAIGENEVKRGFFVSYADLDDSVVNFLADRLGITRKEAERRLWIGLDRLRFHGTPTIHEVGEFRIKYEPVIVSEDRVTMITLREVEPMRTTVRTPEYVEYFHRTGNPPPQ